jgi:MFS family permease
MANALATYFSLLQRAPRYLLYGFLHFFASSVGQTFFISLFVLDITKRMDWAEGTFAYVYSGITLAAAFLLPLVGKQIDRIRIRYVSLATASFLAIACFVISDTNHPVVLVAGLFVVRLGGQGIMPLIGSTTIGRYFTSERGKALSLSLIGIPVAEIIIPSLVVWILAQYGFSTAWIIAGFSMAAVFIPAVWLLIKKRDAFQTAAATATLLADSSEKTLTSWTRNEVLKDARFRVLFPLLLFTPFVMTGMMFNQAIIGQKLTVAAESLALAISCYGFARVCCILFGGSLTDHFGPEALPKFAFTPMLLGLVLFALSQNQWGVFAFYALAGVTAGIESVIWPALWSQRYGPQHLGTIKSTLRVFMVVISAIAPVAFSLGFRWDLGLFTWAVIGYLVIGISLSRKKSGLSSLKR